MINWLTENIGTAAFQNIDVSQTDAAIIDVRDLVDKAGNNETAINKKINESIELLNKHKKIIICCDYGMSRSNSIAAGVIATWKQIPFEDAVTIIRSVVDESGIKLDMLASVYNALNKKQKGKTELKGKRVFITGANGFIGKTLLPRLGKDISFFTASRKEINLEQDIILLDAYVKKHEIDTILHLANPRIYTTNSCTGETLVMLRNVLDVCKSNELKLVYVSSWEVFSGYQANYLLADESLPLQPKGAYGETKWFCELLIEQYRKLYDLSALILRSSPLYGIESDKPKFIYNFIDKAKRGEQILTHKYINGFPLLDLLAVDDFASATISALKSNYEGVINIGSGFPNTTKEIAELITDLMDSKSKLGFNEINSYHPGIVMNNSLAASVLGWKPQTELKQGLLKIIAHLNK